MKKIVLLLTLAPLFLQAQVSYEFKMALPPDGELVRTVSQAHFGSYKNEETGTKFIFDAQGVVMETIIHSYLTKEQVRESSKFQVRNGYVFGVIEGDSIPCIYENEKYYFGIRQQTRLNEGSPKAVVKKVSESTYIINFTEDIGYTPSLLSFKNGNMSLRHFDYPSGTDVFDRIKDRSKTKGDSYDTWLLNPTQKEWDALDRQVIFDKEKLYLKE